MISLNARLSAAVYRGEVEQIALKAEGFALQDEQTLLLRQAKRGDLDAFEELLRRHETQVYRVALRLTNCSDEARDVAQEVFLKLHSNLRRIDESRQLAAWLYRVTVNASMDALRSRRPTAQLHPDIVDSRPIDPDQRLDLEDRRRAVAEALQDLPPKERAAVVLREIEGRSTAEVAAILGSTEATVRSQVSSALGKLKSMLRGKS